MRHKAKPWEHVEAEESGDDQWIVSYADMVTLLFGFFVILYSFSTLDEKKFSQMGDKLASAFKAPEELDKKTTADAGITNESRQIRAMQLLVAMMNNGDSIDDTVKKIESASSNQSEMDSLKALVKDKIKADPSIGLLKGKSSISPTVELILPEKVLFQSGMAELSPAAQKRIQSLGRDLKRIAAVEKIEVVGHTDSSLPGKNALFQSNFALSSARAGAVAQELIKSGISPDMISVKGMADLEPLQIENANQGSIGGDPTVNRRVQIILRKVSRNAE